MIEEHVLLGKKKKLPTMHRSVSQRLPTLLKFFGIHIFPQKATNN